MVILPPESTLISSHSPLPQEHTVRQQNRTGTQHPYTGTSRTLHASPFVPDSDVPSSAVPIAVAAHTSVLQPSAGAVRRPALHAASLWLADSSSTPGQDQLFSAKPVQVIQQRWMCPGTSIHSNCTAIRIIRIKTPVVMVKSHRKPSVPLMQRGTHLCSAGGIVARMAQQMCLRKQLLTVFSGLPI